MRVARRHAIQITLPAASVMLSAMDVVAFTRQLVDIESITGNESEVGDFLSLRSFRCQLAAEKFAEDRNIADFGFVAGNRFDVDELPGECDDVHGREHNRCCRQCNLDSVPTSDSHIKSLFLDGPAGRLEALLNGGAAMRRMPRWSAIHTPFMAGRSITKLCSILRRR